MIDVRIELIFARFLVFFGEKLIHAAWCFLPEYSPIYQLENGPPFFEFFIDILLSERSSRNVNSNYESTGVVSPPLTRNP